MTHDQYERAHSIKSEIRIAERAIAIINEEDNDLGLCPKMFERHKMEQLAYYSDVILQLKSEFEAL